jgi:hypothetical protein
VSLLTEVFISKKYSDTAIPAMHLIAAVLSSNWIEHANYFELIKMYSLLAVAAACYQSHWSRVRKRDNKFIEEIIVNLNSHVHSFIQGLRANYNKKPLINRDLFAEFAYYHPRKKMIAGVAGFRILAKLDNQRLKSEWEPLIINRTMIFRGAFLEFEDCKEFEGLAEIVRNNDRRARPFE